MKKPGKVYLVGAGPGDTGLITKRGFDLIHRADAIVLDALVNPSLLKDVKARIYNVGKRGPGASRLSENPPQSKINSLLIRLARQGSRVVRLKGGDPILFGRGSEELEALRKAGIPYEVVPGVTSAIAVPAYAGIPITDRRWASQVTIITGHEGREKSKSGFGVDWKRISPKGTLIILMGVNRWTEVRRQLSLAGWAAGTPVAAIESGTTASQRIITTTLQTSEADFRRQKLHSPSVIVAGKVVPLTKTLSWIEREKPLLGRRIVITRSSDQSADFAESLEEKGADVFISPAIRIERVADIDAIRQLVRYLKRNPRGFDWIVFLSANGVENFAAALGEDKNVVRRLSLLAIGPKTAQSVRAQGWRVAKTAGTFTTEGVRDVLGNVKGKKFLIPRVQNAPDYLGRQLRMEGGHVSEISTYQTLPVPPTKDMRRLILEGVDAVTFTSGSTARYFLNSFSETERSAIFKKAVALSIGPMTTAALRESGVRNIIESKISTTAGMLETLARTFSTRFGK